MTAKSARNCRWRPSSERQLQAVWDLMPTHPLELNNTDEQGSYLDLDLDELDDYTLCAHAYVLFVTVFADIIRDPTGATNRLKSQSAYERPLVSGARRGGRAVCGGERMVVYDYSEAPAEL